MTDTIIGLAGGILAVLVGSLIPVTKDWLFERRTRQRHANYAAIRLVCIFDQFMEKCVGVAYDDGLAYGMPNRDTGEHEIQVPLPSLQVFPEDIDWKALDPDVMFEVLGYPSEIETANRTIEAVWDYDDPPERFDGFEQRQYQYAMLGLKAHELAGKLRKQTGIKDRDFGNWCPVDVLNGRKERIKKNRQDRGTS